MTRIGTAVVSNHSVVIRGEQIDKFALAFITPLQANDSGTATRAGRSGVGLSSVRKNRA